MESNQVPNRPIRYRHSVRVQMGESLIPEAQPSASRVELLQEIFKHLPESQQTNFKKFEEILREKPKSPPPQPHFDHQYTMLNNEHQAANVHIHRDHRRATMPVGQLVGRSRALSGEEFGKIEARHFDKKIWEIGLMDLGANPYFYNLYIGDSAAANDAAIMIKNRIQGIIVIGNEDGLDKLPSVSNGYFHVVKHKENFVGEAIKAAFKPLDLMLTKGNAMIRCKDGKIHGPLLAIAFLIKKFSISCNDAKEVVLKAHPDVLISSGYENELRHLERAVFGIM